MTTLQNDILEIYNSLVIFSKDVLNELSPKPIKVWFEKESGLLVLEAGGNSVRLVHPIYYCLDLDSITKSTFLLPEDYDFLMSNLQKLINSGELIKERTCLSPENLGFDIYAIDIRDYQKGLDIKGRVRFVSGNSWWFRFKTKLKYKL